MAQEGRWRTMGSREMHCVYKSVTTLSRADEHAAVHALHKKAKKKQILEKNNYLLFTECLIIIVWIFPFYF